MQTYSKYADDDEEPDFKEVPVAIEVDLEEYQFPSSKWIHGLSHWSVKY